jgi:anti-sigma B factor antagonist
MHPSSVAWGSKRGPSSGRPRRPHRQHIYASGLVRSRLVQSNFSVEMRNGDQAVLIGVSGELDLASSPELEAELERATSSDLELVVIDLRKLEFMDSTGLSVLVRAHQKATQNGKRFAIVKGPQQVQRLLSLTGVAERLTVVDEPEELLAGS